MTDLLDRLRDENPVDPTTLDVPDAVRRCALAERSARPSGGRSGWRHARLRPRLALPLAAAAACVAVALTVALGRDAGTGPTPSLAARAVAATSGAGVVHWRIEQHNFSNGNDIEHLRIEGWSRRGVTRVVRSRVRHGRATLRSDTRIAGTRGRQYRAAGDDYLEFPASPLRGAAATNPLTDGDPFATFRRAYHAGRLTALGPHRYAVRLPGRDATLRPVYELDPATAMPRALTLRTTNEDRGRRYVNRLVMRFTTYELLPDTAASRAKLALLPHPGAGPKDDPVLPHFAVLRAGPRPSPQDLARVRALPSPPRNAPVPRFDPDRARGIGGGRYVVPGRGALCAFAVSDRGVGSTCQTLARVLKHGLAFVSFTPGKNGKPIRNPIPLVVPDGVRAVRARVRGGTTATVPVRANVAVLPGGAYDWWFVHG